MRLDASTGATGRRQQLELMIEMVVECGRCGLALMAAWGTWPCFVATGRGPAGGEIDTAWSQSSDRGHEVSILMATVGVDGW